jgi:hypothetical protein
MTAIGSLHNLVSLAELQELRVQTVDVCSRVRPFAWSACSGQYAIGVE